METVIRIACMLYVMASPLFMIYLQQGLFRDSFDDEHGSKLIFRLHAVSCIACICLVAMTYGVCPGGRPFP